MPAGCCSGISAQKWTWAGSSGITDPKGLATPQTQAATMFDFGGYYYFRKPAFQLLFCLGHTVVGQSETYAYLGLYWTWGNKKNASAASAVDWSRTARTPVTLASP